MMMPGKIDERSQCEIYVCIFYAVHLCTLYQLSRLHDSPNYFFGASTLIYILFDLYFHLKRNIFSARILLCGGSLVLFA